MNFKVKVAIIDSGINNELAQGVRCKDKFVINDNICEKDNLASQNIDYLHGTICSLIIQKYCPACVFSSIRVLNQKGKGTIEKIEPALEWCIQNDIKIVNLSLGTTHFKDEEKLNTLINRYAYKGLIIVAALSNVGYITFPASFSNVIGVATEKNSLPYANDFIHLGIDAAVPSEHIIKLGDEEHITSLSNSYAAPYVTSLIAQKMIDNKNCDLYMLKNYISKKSSVAIERDLYNPDWIYRAYIKNKKSNSKANYYFATLKGSYECVAREIDTVIAYSKVELASINIVNKNLVYLGEEDVENINVSGFKWSWQTRVQQIAHNQYKGNGLTVPLVVIEIKEGLDKYFILSELRQCFGNDGYNAYIISGEPESVLYRFEYIPMKQTLLASENVKDFIEGQIFYKQSDLILWKETEGSEISVCSIYSEFDVKMVFDDTEILIYTGQGILNKQNYKNLSKKHIKDIYKKIVSYLTEEGNE